MTSSKTTAVTEGTNDMNANHVPRTEFSTSNCRKEMVMSTTLTPSAPTVTVGNATRNAPTSNATRKIAFVTGVLFLITFVTSIPAQLFLYHPLLTDPAKYILGTGGDPAVSLGALLEVMLAIAGIGSAVVLYPIVKRQNHTIALAYVTSRVLESAAIMVGIFSVLSVVTLRHDFAGAVGADHASLITAARSLVAVHDAAFLLGPTLLAGVGNGVLLGYLMYRSGLVPQRMALLGLIGGPLVIAATVCVLFGVFKAGASWQFIATIPEI
ncbi:MAG: DUF4386 domain-containing protein, partial [Chloroflexota bacterium]|nr:DUF4386 domain-containing protein [Chloroflexota bacterium]